MAFPDVIPPTEPPPARVTELPKDANVGVPPVFAGESGVIALFTGYILGVVYVMAGVVTDRVAILTVAVPAPALFPKPMV